MMSSCRRYAIVLAALVALPASAHATQPKIDADTCTQLRLEQAKFRQSGILNDMSKGPEWAKANLSPDRLREVEHYIQLDEQVEFGCRDAKLSPDAEKASKAAARIEINSDADPTAPLPADPAKPGSKAKSKSSAHKHAKHKKSKSADPKSGSLDQSKMTTKSSRSESPGPQPTVADSSEPVASTAGSAPPAFGFGETVVTPPPSP